MNYVHDEARKKFHGDVIIIIIFLVFASTPDRGNIIYIYKNVNYIICIIS